MRDSSEPMIPASTATANTRNPRRSSKLLVLILVWAGLVAGGFGFLDWYSNAPGAAGDPPGHWPLDTKIQPDGKRPTLLMFIHPRCPCTQASLEELAKILTHSKDMATVYAVFVRPSGVPVGWERDANWQRAAAIPEVKMIVDENGTEACLFGATTSGQVDLYDARGRLCFSGGITGARNHAGDNKGADAVYEWLRWGESTCNETFVFGCPLLESTLRRDHKDCRCRS